MVPLVRFRGTLLNLTKIDYVALRPVGDGGTVCKLKVVFTGSDSHNLVWSFKDRASADAAMEELNQLNETYMIPEFP